MSSENICIGKRMVLVEVCLYLYDAINSLIVFNSIESWTKLNDVSREEKFLGEKFSKVMKLFRWSAVWNWIICHFIEGHVHWLNLFWLDEGASMVNDNYDNKIIILRDWPIAQKKPPSNKMAIRKGNSIPLIQVRRFCNSWISHIRIYLKYF